MPKSIASIALVVRDYDEAIRFYTQKLKFDLIEDTPLTDKKRWVLVSPCGSMGQISCSPKRIRLSRKAALGIKQADGYFYSCTQMIFGAITTK